MGGYERKNAGEEARRHQAHLFTWQKVARRGTRCITRADASWRHLPVCICSASETQLSLSPARLAVMCHGVESWGEVTCVVAGSFPFLALGSAYKECGKPEESGGEKTCGQE